MSLHARVWLAARAGGVPPLLEAYMEAAVDDVPGAGEASVAGELCAAGLTCLVEALHAGDERAAALPLLAADALITAACEAAVESGELDAIAEACSPARLAALVAASRGGGGS